jgi:cyclomaltodextrinase / maltogenic alpha-amylase / neopullulanase
MKKHFNSYTSIVFIVIVIITFLIQFLTDTQKISKSHPEWSQNVAIYEANIRQHSPEGTFKAYEEYLPQLKEMGIGLIWIMPIQPIGEINRKGTLGSYYSISDYTAINPEFGTLDDFKSLVNKIHELDMHIIIDWVANHTAWDHPWVESNPEFYTKDSTGNFVPPVPDWADVIDLNYNNENLRKEMYNSMKYWIEECNIDGFRCDVAAMVPTDFWNNVTTDLNKIKPIFMLAEATEPELHEAAFDMTYGWGMLGLINDIAKGNKTVEDLDAYFTQQKVDYPSDAYQMMFTTNHDENSWNGTVQERLGEAVETFAVFTGVIGGMPLIYSGQEAGLDKPLEFFEKDSILWKEHNLRGVYTKLFQLKKQNKAIWNGEAGGMMVRLKSSNDKNIFSFTREKDEDKVIAFFNLSTTKYSFTIDDELLVGDYTNLFTDEKVELKKTESFNLESWEYIVLTK